MKYDEIVEMWATDSKIDSENLSHESLNIPMLQGKYFNLFCREKAILTKLTLDLNQLKRWKRDYFLGEIPPEELIEKGIPVFARRLVKSEVDAFVDTDNEVVNFLEKIAVVQTKVDFLNLCVKSMNDRQWNIRNAIEFLKWKHGVT
jgi:hypothetical protein